ncbi:hypothetical protein D6833_02925 [Candidatus Parcubacteria bacterium]|nr:MAG: hypothetical protein D6833_02925 [Candidatus Parcubacteria bacterium]
MLGKRTRQETKVRRFHVKLGKVLQFLQRAGHMSRQDLELQMQLIEEETEELRNAVVEYIAETNRSDATDYSLAWSRALVAKEVADVLYTAVGMAYLVGFGKRLPEIFDIVAESNLEKVAHSFVTDSRGKVLKRADLPDVMSQIHGLFIYEANKAPIWARLVYRLARLVSRVPRLPSKVYMWAMRVQVWYVRKSFEKSIDFPVETQEDEE